MCMGWLPRDLGLIIAIWEDDIEEISRSAVPGISNHRAGYGNALPCSAV